MSIVFGDIDPEDEWDADDPRAVKLGVLIRWALSVLIEHAYEGETLRVLHRAGEARARADALQADDLSAVDAATIALIIFALAAIK